jgi:microcystin-dependent protein
MYHVFVFPEFPGKGGTVRTITIICIQIYIAMGTGRMVFYFGAPGTRREIQGGSRMSQSYIGEVRLVGFNFAPVGWAICNGQLIPIAENNALFNLIGTTYGGDGQSTFGVPNLQGRIPIHQGTLAGGANYVIGQTGGVETVPLGVTQYPSHNHALLGSSNSGNVNNPSNQTVGSGLKVYQNEAPATPMNTSMVGPSGGASQPHENRQPYQVLNWIISLYGIYPTQG